MPATWQYARDLAAESDRIGFDLTLVAELNLNDIKRPEAPSLDAWSTAAALAAVTRRLELIVAVRPTFYHPALFAKQAANIDRISGGRLALNVVSSWWKDGMPERIAERLEAFERAGVDLTLLQFSPQAEEMERFAEEVIPLARRQRREVVA